MIHEREEDSKNLTGSKGGAPPQAQVEQKPLRAEKKNVADEAAKDKNAIPERDCIEALKRLWNKAAKENFQSIENALYLANPAITPQT